MEENKYISFLQSNWKKGVYALLILGCVGIWGERFYRRNHNKSAQDFIALKQLAERFKQAQSLPIESIEQAALLVKRHPELHPAYDGMLAQAFFSMNNPSAAAPYADAAAKRISPVVNPYYSAFAKATALIAKGQLSDAYILASNLEYELADLEECAQLRAFNLLRLLFLADSVNKGSECANWKTRLQEHPLYSQVSSLFSQGDLSLDRYLEDRLS